MQKEKHKAKKNEFFYKNLLYLTKAQNLRNKEKKHQKFMKKLWHYKNILTLGNQKNEMSSHQSEMQWFKTANDILLNFRLLNIFQANLKMYICHLSLWLVANFLSKYCREFEVEAAAAICHTYLSAQDSVRHLNRRTHVLSWKIEK